MAKATSLADSLGKHLECAVCLEQYTEPKVLPCLHSFCKRCLHGLLTEKGAVFEINCPTCRSSAEVPQGEIDLLPANFFVNNLLSLVTLHEDSGSCNLECDICDSGDPPVNRCTTCSHFLCEFCTQGHQRGRSTRSHSLVSLEAKKMGLVAVTKPSLCKEHEGEVIKLFCETCEEAICRDCTIVKHRDHKYTFVKDAFSKGKESLLKMMSETKTKATVLNKAVDGVSQMERNVHSCAEQTMQEVVHHFKLLSTCLNARRVEMITKVEEFKKAKLKSLEIQKKQLETALASVQSSVEFTERAFENGSEVEILNMRKQMSNRLQDLNSATWQLEPCVNEELKFKDKHYCQLEASIAAFGAVTDVVTHAGASTVTMENGQEGVMYNALCGQPLEFKIIAKEQNGRNRIEGGDVFYVTIDTDGYYGKSKVLEVNDCGNGTYSFSHTPTEKGHYLLSVLLHGHHVHESPFSCSVENWGLVQCSLAENSSGLGQIYLTDEALTAEYILARLGKVTISNRQVNQMQATMHEGPVSEMLGNRRVNQMPATMHQRPVSAMRGNRQVNQMPATMHQRPVSAMPGNRQVNQMRATMHQHPVSVVLGNRQVNQMPATMHQRPVSAMPGNRQVNQMQTMHERLPYGCTTSIFGTPLSANADAPTAFGTDLVSQGTCTRTGLASLTSNRKVNWSSVASSYSQNSNTDTTPFVEGSVGFSAGKYMWKVQIFGSVLQAGFCFGIRNHTSDGSLLENWWVWSSKQVHQLHPLLGDQARRGSTITDLANGDIIELYLDCEKGTLMMYNPRTEQSDTLAEVTGEVTPVFCMTTHGDKVSLKV